jgi:hypothetical protein
MKMSPMTVLANAHEADVEENANAGEQANLGK